MIRKALLLGAAFALLLGFPYGSIADGFKAGKKAGARNELYGVTAGGIGNDATLDHLGRLQSIAQIPSNFEEYYLSADTSAGCPGDLPQGNDATGDGSRTKPWRSIAMGWEASRAGHVIIWLDSCDVWDTNDGGGAGDNESTTQTLDVLGNAIVYTGTDLLACRNDPHELCVLWSGTDLSGVRKPVIDSAAWDGSTEGSGLFHMGGGTFDATVDKYGYLVAQNLVLKDFPKDPTVGSDLYRSNQETGSFLVLNVDHVGVAGDCSGTGCTNSSPLNEVWTSHNNMVAVGQNDKADWAIYINTYTEYRDLSPADNTTNGSFVPFLNSGSSALILINNEVRMNTRNETGAGTNNQNTTCFGMAPSGSDQSNYMFAARNECHMTANAGTSDGAHVGFGAGNGSAFTPSGYNNVWTKYALAENTITQGDHVASTFGAFINWINQGENPRIGPRDTLILRAFRNSSIKSTHHFFHSASNNNAGTDTLLEAWCNIHEPAPTTNWDVFLRVSNSDNSGTDLDWRDNLVDETSGFPYIPEGTTYTNIADFCTNTPTVKGWNGGAAFTECNNNYTAARDITSATLVLNAATAGGNCTDPQCRGQCPHSWYETFSLGIAIPKWVLGTDTHIYGFHLNQAGTANIGR